MGFIQRLPTDLIAAFRATLEEIKDSTLLLHVVDISSPLAGAQVAAVEAVLEDLGALDIPRVTVWNKVDALTGHILNDNGHVPPVVHQCAELRPARPRAVSVRPHVPAHAPCRASLLSGTQRAPRAGRCARRHSLRGT